MITPSQLKVSKHSLQSPEYIKKIMTEMELTLKENPSHYFVTSNMLNYNDSNLVLLNVINQKLLINPKITNFGDNKITNFLDTSLLFPNEIVETTIFSKIIVTADNVNQPILFGVDKVESDEDMLKLLECGYLQNAIDTLKGKTFYHRQTSILNKNIKPNVFYSMTKGAVTKKVQGKFIYRELNLGFKLV